MAYRIFQLELTNDCNYRCTYCPRTLHMTRPVQAMSRSTVLRVIRVMPVQLALRIHHYGESLLEKDLCLWTIEKLRNSGKVKHIILNTNGSLLTRSIVDALFAAGLSHLNVSYHTAQSIVPLLDKHVIRAELRAKISVLRVVDPAHMESAKLLMKKLADAGYAVELKRMRNLGQIGCADDSNSEKVMCAFLANNEWIVQANGDIGTCCHTFDKEGVIGNVWQSLDELNALTSSPYKHCQGCAGYTNDGDADVEVVSLFDTVAAIGSVVRQKAAL